MKRIVIPALILTFATTMLFSCKKYESGGIVKRGDNNLIETWKLNSYLRNGKDETSKILISNYSEQYTENGTYIQSYTSTNGISQKNNGTYKFESGQQELHLSGSNSINDFSYNTTSLSTSHTTILKLTKEEFWYSFKNGSDEHEFHLTKE